MGSRLLIKVLGACVCNPVGTRKVGHMKEVPGNLIHNLPHLMRTLWGAIAWAQAGHRRGASLKDCMDLSGKLLDVPHIVATLLFDSIVAEVIQPFARKTQERDVQQSGWASAQRVVPRWGRGKVACPFLASPV